MSQHYFDTQYKERGVQVVLGYDRPLGHFFLTIMYTEPPGDAGGADHCSDEDDDTIVYSNLEDADAGFDQDLDYYRAKLTSLGITAPESMYRETQQDAIDHVGNRFVRHHVDGRLETLG